MKNLILLSMIAFCTLTATAQTPDLDKKTAEIKALYKAKDLVYEIPIQIYKDSLSFLGTLNLPKDKYIIYAIVDNEAIKKATFHLRFEAMKGKMNADEDKNRETIGKGWKAYKEFFCKPRIIETEAANVEFKIDDVTALGNRMMAMGTAQYNANATGMSQTYNRYPNGCMIKIKFEFAPEDFLKDYDRQVKILIFNR